MKIKKKKLVRENSKLINSGYRQAGIIEIGKKFASVKAVLFDLDGTLTKSKAGLDREMSSLLDRLLAQKSVLVIGGGNLTQFQKQFLARFNCAETRLQRLFIAPTSGASMYRNENGKWREVYRHVLAGPEKEKIIDAFKRVLNEKKYSKPAKIYGKVIEDRKSQITFSALGQKAPLTEKEKWNKESDFRLAVKKSLRKYLPEFEVRLGGLTSIDVTKKGIDKAYGVRRFAKIIKTPIRGMVYVGDALYKGGNDAIVKKTGIPTVQIYDLKETKLFVRALLGARGK